MHKLLGIAVLFGIVCLVQSAARLQQPLPHKQQANIETINSVKVKTIKEIFRNKNNTALEIQVNKRVLIHNILEVLEMVHYACVKTGPPLGGKEVCRKKISGVVNKYLDVIFDVVELFNFQFFNKRFDMKDPKNMKTFGKIAANVYGGL